MKVPDWWFPDDEYVRAGRDWTNLLGILSLGLCLLAFGLAISLLVWLFAGAAGWAHDDENVAREVAGMGNWSTEEPPEWAVSFVKSGKVASLFVAIAAVATAVGAFVLFLWPKKVVVPRQSPGKRRVRPSTKGGGEGQ